MSYPFKTTVDYNSSVLDPLPTYLIKRLSRVQICAVAFVNNRYAGENYIINLGWLPIPERREYHLLKLAHKALHNPQWPPYDGIQLVLPLTTGTFQYSFAKTFNRLPKDIRNCTNYVQFSRLIKTFFMDSARESIELKLNIWTHMT